MQKSLLSIISAIVILIFISVFWVKLEKSDSYSEPHEALFAIDKNLLLISAYKINDKALFFFIKDKNNLGATYVQKSPFGWKSGMLTCSPMNNERSYETLSGYQGHGENLIYGLIKHGDDRLIQIGENTATILNLAMLSPSEVAKYRLEGLYIWYFESDTFLNEGEIKLINKNTKDVLDIINL